MESEMNTTDLNVENVIAELLQQNANLRLEVSVLRVRLAEQDSIEAQMTQSQAIPPHVAEMLSKFDIR